MHGSLRTHAWNMSRGAAAAAVLGAACGPTAPGTADTEGGACVRSEDCGPGYTCFEGQCYGYGEEDDYDYDYDCGGSAGCCDYPCYDTDTDGDTDPLGECRENADCGEQQMCTPDLVCEDPLPLPECPAPSITVLPLAETSDDPLVSFAFVDANGDLAQDLVVGRDGSAELRLGPGDAEPIALPVPPGLSVIDAAAGDLDGDGGIDLVVSGLLEEGGLIMVLTSNGAGGYDAGYLVATNQPTFDLATLEWNGDGMLDVVGRYPEGPVIVELGDGMGAFDEAIPILSPAPVTSLAVTNLVDDAYDDLVLWSLDGVELHLGDETGDPPTSGVLPSAFPPGGLASGAIDGGAPHEVVAYGSESGWTHVELWANATLGAQYHVLPGPSHGADMGDFDGDGVADLVVLGEGSIAYVRGSNASGTPAFTCVSTYEDPAVTGAAVGDFDGNLRVDVVIGSPRGLAVLLTQ